MIVHLFNSSIVSGPEMLVLPALKQWASEGRAVEVWVLTETRLGSDGRHTFEYSESLGLMTRAIPIRSRLDFTAVRALAKLIEENKPEVIHAHDVKASLYAWMADRGKSLLVSTHHGIFGRPDLKTWLYERFYSHWILRHFDGVIAVSADDEKVLLHRGIRRDLLQMISNGVTRPAISSAERAEVQLRIRKEWGVMHPGPLLGVVARFSREKRHDRILQVAQCLHRLEPQLPWQILFFGSGDLEAELQKSAANQLPPDRFRFMGYRPTIGVEMAGFDLLLSLSDAEGLPISMIEAGWAQTPVFSTDVGAVSILLDHAEWVVPRETSDMEIAKKIHTLLRERHLLNDQGQRFQERVRLEFSSDRWRQDHLHFYEKLRRSRFEAFPNH